MRAAGEDVRRLGLALLVHAGASFGDADAVVTHLLEADAMGVRSHGVMRVPQYLAEITAGELDPRGDPSVAFGKAGRAFVDGGGSFGQVVGIRMASVAVDLARSSGIALVTGRRMGHTGRIGAYAEAIAASGLLALVVCSGPPSGHWVAPFGGREGRLATNPIAFAYPTGVNGPVVADFSTAATAEGVVRGLRQRGLHAAPGLLRDAGGRPTTDPAVLYTSPRGAIQPLGGELGYRGTALALLVEVLATLLAGDTVDDERRRGSNLAIMAIEVDPGFAVSAAALGRHIRSSAPIDPARPVIIPGDRERVARTAAETPIELDSTTWTALADAAARAGVPGLTDLDEGPGSGARHRAASLRAEPRDRPKSSG